MKQSNVLAKMAQIIKKNAYYIVLFLCVAAIGTLVSLSLIQEETYPLNPDNNGDSVIETPGGDEVGGDVTTPGDDTGVNGDNSDNIPTIITFVTPVGEGYVGLDYTDSAIVWQATLNQYQTHLGIDYVSTAGTAVNSAYMGEVEEVGENLLDGKYVIINHGDGLTTVYTCLQEITVSIGDKVATGEQIGMVGNSGIKEYKTGDHLHFEVRQDGVCVNPYTYLTEDNK